MNSCADVKKTAVSIAAKYPCVNPHILTRATQARTNLGSGSAPAGTRRHRSGRDAQAIDLYNALIAKPNDAVPVYTAQLALADLYSASGKTEQAKQIWAKVKDADKAGAAGSIAAEKLTAKK